MQNDNINFLIELQHKLNSQSNDGNADPIFWGVIERKKVYAPSGYGERIELRISGDDDPYDEDQLDELKEWMKDSGEFDKSKLDTINNLYDAELALGEKNYEYEIFRYDYKDILSTDTGAFLTKEACQHYIKTNEHNHSNPRSYAMTAYKNFELERLLQILKTADFRALVGNLHPLTIETTPPNIDIKCCDTCYHLGRNNYECGYWERCNPSGVCDEWREGKSNHNLLYRIKKLEQIIEQNHGKLKINQG